MALFRLLLSVLFLGLAATVASAYTVVMRDGRQVVIPDQFAVTQSTLTYEVSPGIQITIQLASVNIAATERANGQPSGSLLQRANAPEVSAPAKTQPVVHRSITNDDLESYRKARVQNELAYEKRRQELGLPSFAERQRELAEIEERTRQQVEVIRSGEENTETYWRNRAAALRAEIAATQAQIGYSRRRLDEIPLSYSFGAVATTIPFGAVTTPVVGFPFQRTLASNVVGPAIVTAGRVGRSGSFQATFQSGRQGFPGIVSPGRLLTRGAGRFHSFPGTVLALPFQSLDYNLERTELVSQLNNLEMHLAGLKARWRELEDDARRAGAYPGWLR